MAVRKDINLLVELESDILLLQALIDEVNFFTELLFQDTENPEEVMFNKTSYESAVGSFLQHKEYLRPRLEEYMNMCQENNYPVNIGYYRVLRAMKDSDV